ncbi:MAG: hydroxyacylglutathione hydrolase [Pseudomonadota bacterium]
MSLEVHQFPCLSDNYGYLIHDSVSGQTAVIDTPDANKILEEAQKRGWTITTIWNTHWHPDHAGGNQAIKSATGCEIIGPAGEAEKIPGIDRKVGDGDIVTLGAYKAQVLDTPGHTLGHIIFYVPDAGLAFVGDTVFALGCGRLFEGKPAQMWDSLGKVRALPPETLLYCAHEYTQANARFAITVEPDNADLKSYVNEIDDKRSRDEWTVPTRLDRELATNPFLRADHAPLQAAMGHPGDPVATFAEIRGRKDRF